MGNTASNSCNEVALIEPGLHCILIQLIIYLSLLLFFLSALVFLICTCWCSNFLYNALKQWDERRRWKRFLRENNAEFEQRRLELHQLQRSERRVRFAEDVV